MEFYVPPKSTRRTLRERWIRRYQGFFGDPPKLGQYRAKEITFGELYRSACKMAEDMATEARSIDAGAFSDRDHSDR